MCPLQGKSNIRVSRSELVVCLLIISATVSVFWPVRIYEFVSFDDRLYVVNSLQVQSGLTWDGLLWAFTTTHASNWHPLTWLSHMLDCELYGIRPAGHHLTNVFLHIVNTLLLFLILKRTTGALWQSAFVAVLFAIHPLHVESVAWVSERKDVLSTFFWMLTMGAYLRYVASPGLGQYLLVLLLFALGLMAKPMLVTLPFVLLLMDYWPLGRFHLAPWRDDSSPNIPKSTNLSGQPRPPLGLVWEKLPLFAVSALASLVTLLVQQSEAAVQSFASFPLKVRMANALISYVSYIGKMIWPHHLAVFYPHPGHVAVWKIAGAGFFLVCVSALVIRMARRHPYLATGWLWYLGTLVPVIGLVQVGGQAMADRYTYVPLIGLFIILVWGSSELVLRWRYRKLVLCTGTGLLFCVLVFCTRGQLEHWRNSIMLFQHAISMTRDNYVANTHLGAALMAQGNINEGIIHFSEALQIKPDYAEGHYNLGCALADRGTLNEAAVHYSEALRIKPDYAEAHNNLGTVRARQGSYNAAITHFSRALSIKPDFEAARRNLKQALTLADHSAASPDTSGRD